MVNANWGEAPAASKGALPKPRSRAPGQSRLSFRIAALLTFALLPLGLIAILQTLDAIDTSRESYRQNLAAQTNRAARPESAAIMRAFGLARGLADAMPSLAERPEDCVATMQRTVARHGSLNFAGFITADQTTTCNNLDRRFDFSDNPQSTAVFARGAPDITFSPAGNATGDPVVIVSQPVRDGEGRLTGFVSLSFPATPLAETQTRTAADPDLTLITFNDKGRVLTAAGPLPEVGALVPRDGGLRALVGRDAEVFSAVSQDGVRREFALAPIVSGQAYALGIWDVPHLRQSGFAAVARAAAFPILMWLASLTVAVIALQRLVVAPISALRMRMRSFADGRSVFRASSIPGASRELAEIGETFEAMAEKVVRDEAELEDRLQERDMLLREVHHRVKNNLQLMSSIINMQMRQDKGAEAEEALRSVQDRLGSLAKFHQDLYKTSSLSRMRADQLLEDLARQMISLTSGPNHRIDLRLSMDEVRLDPDQAGPLAMLVTEALTNALKHAREDANTPLFIALTMKKIPDAPDHTTGRIEVAVENSLLPPDPEESPSVPGLGTRLIRAFGSQLEAKISQERLEDRYRLVVTFAAMEPKGT